MHDRRRCTWSLRRGLAATADGHADADVIDMSSCWSNGAADTIDVDICEEDMPAYVRFVVSMPPRQCTMPIGRAADINMAHAATLDASMI